MLLRTAPTTASFDEASTRSIRAVRLPQVIDTAEKGNAWTSIQQSALRRAHAAPTFAFGAAWFAICSLVVSMSPRPSLVLPASILATLDVAVVLLLTRFLGVAYGVTVGVAGVVALDWYCIPPVHDQGLPDSRNALVLGAYLVTGALLGQLSAETRRRAQESEVQARDLASEQAALRRVATLVATEPGPDTVFEVVTREVGELLGLDLSALLRYESDGTATVAGGWSRSGPPPPLDSCWALRGNTIAEALHTRAPRHVEDPAKRIAPLDTWRRQVGARSVVGSPVVVHGTLWGVMVGASVADAPLPEGTEVRLGEFTDLVATAIANAASRRELAASRARIVRSGDQARRRIERDLHDGVQQRLVSLALDVRLAAALAGQEQIDLHGRLEDLRAGLVGAIDDLRDVVHGIHPPILAECGLRAALATLARRSPIPIEVSVRGLGRLPDPVEVCLYYVASECITNALKHARATMITVDLELDEAVIVLVIRDDGVGGADLRSGSGLVGLVDRLQALGGALEMQSPALQGTRLEVRVPLADDGSNHRESASGRGRGRPVITPCRTDR
jgi:signal transduction histidine kinase